MADRNDRIDGRDACLAALRERLLALPGEAPRVVWCIDSDFADWPFDDTAVLQALQRWAQAPGRLLKVVGVDYDAVTRRFPRLAAWRRDWSHCVQAWQPAPDERVDLPSVLLAGTSAVELLDRERWRGRTLRDAAELRQLGEACDAITQRCEPAWPATTLGL
ncbi:hypothetical protein HLB44_22260 [Aquincola sp. S2]|uniref:Uncharacterized protein n=1 Tax=Pseudaquabacterium terrae TaxID=2732868 RepID=A0ABX2EMB8_9BURK|nr:hypothetical protein [Aquabacterium terrae]NRF69733.1 hypothetical protein [Aquabacterium terrae]